MTHSTLPTNSEDRIITVDALRGFALFGIIYAHMIFWYTAGPLPQQLFNENIGIASGITMALYGIFFLSKFFSFFSFLFGLSFYIQMKSLMKRNDNFVLRYAWRLLILGVIGIIHHAVWRGDILSIYVPLGFLLLFARNLSNKTILIIGFILILNIPTKIYEAVNLSIHGKTEIISTDMEKEGEHYYDVVKNAPFYDLVVDNMKALSTKFDYQITSGRLLITLGFFLLGMFVGRMKWFENLDEAKPIIKSIWKKISFTLLGALGFTLVVAGLNFGLKLNLETNPWVVWASGFLVEVFNSGVTLFYITGLTLLMFRSKWQKILFPLASIGKLALTSYLMQTLIGLFLFYSFGLALFTRTTPAINALLCVIIFSFQIVFSKVWLRYFMYGPVEWLWRSLTFFKFQPLTRKTELNQMQEADIVVEK